MLEHWLFSNVLVNRIWFPEVLEGMPKIIGRFSPSSTLYILFIYFRYFMYIIIILIQGGFRPMIGRFSPSSFNQVLNGFGVKIIDE